MDWPYWWEWPFDSDRTHVRKRMSSRRFNDVELREMLERATAWFPDVMPGRFVIVASYAGVDWHIIVEPNDPAEVVEVVTAYRPSVDTE